MMQFDISCPNCHTLVHIPFMRELKARAIKEFDLAEVYAQDKLSSLELWLETVSFWGLIKWWITRQCKKCPKIQDERLF